MENSFAYYRLPYADHYNVVTSHEKPLILDSIRSIGSRTGFIIAPFNADSHPIVLIETDMVEEIPMPKNMTREGDDPHPDTEEPVVDSYAQPFRKFHDAVGSGTFRKLVLARNKQIGGTVADDSLLPLFLKACGAYPRLMVMLFHTPMTGTWFITSPEILIEQQDSILHTVALAGTMPYSHGYASWTEKNKEEQHIVEQYIESIITPFASEVIKDGPITMRAGNLMHLRTDFRFKVAEQSLLGEILTLLHPTPAVCGMPQKEAMRFILDHEGMDRSYYSGFAGPIGIDNATHLYVSLRCACLTDGITLYAGGGIMPDSTCESEWRETEQKMQTIAHVLQ